MTIIGSIGYLLGSLLTIIIFSFLYIDTYVITSHIIGTIIAGVKFFISYINEIDGNIHNFIFGLIGGTLIPLLFSLFNINNFVYNCFFSCISGLFIGLLIVNYLKPDIYSNNIKNININNFILPNFEKLTDNNIKKLKNIDNNTYSTFLFQRLCYNELVKQLKNEQEFINKILNFNLYNDIIIQYLHKIINTINILNFINNTKENDVKYISKIINNNNQIFFKNTSLLYEILCDELSKINYLWKIKKNRIKFLNDKDYTIDYNYAFELYDIMRKKT
jgi:hypothetical protein